jgi:site-specific DNA-cytosine methylase
MIPKQIYKNMFGGIGSAIIALKRLQIAIATIIYVDHDKVAQTVYRYNHDPFLDDRDTATTNNVNDNEENDSNRIIQHQYYTTLQEFRQAYEAGHLDTRKIFDCFSFLLIRVGCLHA